MYNDFARMPVDNVEAGDICAFTGVNNVSIGDTICSRDSVVALPTITVRYQGLSIAHSNHDMFDESLPLLASCCVVRLSP